MRRDSCWITLSRSAVDEHLKIVGDRLMQAFGDMPPYAVFSDSLEVYGTDWTDDLLPEFARRRGYDLTPYLPELASGYGRDKRRGASRLGFDAYGVA